MRAASRPSERDIDAAEKIAPGSRRIEAAEDVHGGRLAGTRRAHDGDELAARDRKIDAGQRPHEAGAFAIELLHPLEGDEAVRHVHCPGLPRCR